MTPFSHPTIPRSEIVAVLNQCRIAAVSETDIQNPSLKFVFDVYSALLFYLDVLQDGYGQVEFEALERFENLDWHVDSVRVTNLCDKIKEFLAEIGCSAGFKFNDLAQPVGNRTLKFLSAFVNYILYKPNAFFCRLTEAPVMVAEFMHLRTSQFHRKSIS